MEGQVNILERGRKCVFIYIICIYVTSRFQIFIFKIVAYFLHIKTVFESCVTSVVVLVLVQSVSQNNKPQFIFSVYVPNVSSDISRN